MNRHRDLLFFLTLAWALLPQNATAASCKTESQMTPAERNMISRSARAMVGEVQSGDMPALRSNTIPAVAADFGAIAASAQSLKPLVQHGVITVDNIYALDASGEPAGATGTDFYCGTPVVSLNFSSLPPGKYALVILHATGVSKPQQISLILSETTENHWMLAGFFTSPMIEAGHDGLWYWVQAREYGQKKMNWNAWFYYQIAASLLDPLDFLSSPNIEKLQLEASRVRPDNLPGVNPMILNAHGSAFRITALNTTTELGGLDLEVHYIPDAAQLVELHDPTAARKQAVDVMAGLLALHPELRAAFHGIWARADEGNASVYALDLPMTEIAVTTEQPSGSGSNFAAH